MSKENETEKIIKEKLNSREFAFDEKAWAGMETLLDAQDKKRRRGAFWWFSASMLVVLVAGAAWFLNRLSDSNQNISVLSQNASVLDENTTVLNQNTAVLDNNTTVSSQNTTVLSQNMTVSNQNTAVLDKNTTVLDDNTTVSDQNTIVFNNNATVSNINAVISNQNTTVSDNNTTVSNNNTVVSNQNAIVFNQNTTVSDNNTTILVKNEAVSSEISVDSAKTAEKAPETALDSAETAKNPLTAPGKEIKNAWGVMAGVGYLFPYYSTIGENDNRGIIGFTGGIYYQRTFSNRIELGVSAVYSSRGALNYDKTFTNSNYGFGIESDITTISPQTLHYLNFPLHIRFNISQRSHISIGAAYYQLLATTSKVTHTIESSFASTLTSSEKQTGEHKGFRKNDIAAFIGYELTLFDRMNAGLQFSYGFYDITNNSYNNLNGNDRNISLQLHLKYDLIRH
ncbi:MAG: hypothetical protein POELPBGB_01875 [Bacteroidia bacterium]|nr:hypothetical protein [Bacteroidia bacterium]